MAHEPARALELYRKAAAQEYVPAMRAIGWHYQTGQGVPRDYVQAYMWSSLSAARGHQEGVKNRDSIAKGMTPAQLADAQRRASAWKPTNPPR